MNCGIYWEIRAEKIVKGPQNRDWLFGSGGAEELTACWRYFAGLRDNRWWGRHLRGIPPGNRPAEGRIRAGAAGISLLAASIRAAAPAIGAVGRRISPGAPQISPSPGRISRLRGKIWSDPGEISSWRGRIWSDPGEISSWRGKIWSDPGEISSSRGKIWSNPDRISSLRGKIWSNLSRNRSNLPRNRSNLPRRSANPPCHGVDPERRKPILDRHLANLIRNRAVFGWNDADCACRKHDPLCRCANAGRQFAVARCFRASAGRDRTNPPEAMRSICFVREEVGRSPVEAAFFGMGRGWKTYCHKKAQEAQELRRQTYTPPDPAGWRMVSHRWGADRHRPQRISGRVAWCESPPVIRPSKRSERRGYHLLCGCLHAS